MCGSCDVGLSQLATKPLVGERHWVTPSTERHAQGSGASSCHRATCFTQGCAVKWTFPQCCPPWGS